MPDELLLEALANPVPFTAPEATLSPAPDAVFCKRQNTHRKQPAEPKGRERKTVSTCCATLRLQDGRPMVSATSSCKELANALHSFDCCLLSDGERKIAEEFLPALSPHVANLHHVLDWHHLHLRSSQLLSLSIRGEDCRNLHLDALMRLLWHGCPDSAIALLGNIPKVHLKPPKGS